MFAWLLITAAFADDPSGARPGAAVPELKLAPVLELRTGFETDDVASGGVIVARSRVGIEASRKAFTARVSVGGATDASLPLDGQPSFSASVPEAWVRAALPVGSAMSLDLQLGEAPLEFDDGVLVGAQDRKLDQAQFPLLAHLHLRATPWELDVAAADDFASGRHRPFEVARCGAGRDNPAFSWHLAGVGLLFEPGLGQNPVDRPTFGTAGLTGAADFGRTRLRADAYLQPTLGEPAWMAGGQAGYAFGDDGRVELAVRLDTESGGVSPIFRRPLATRGERFGWSGRYDDQQAVAGVIDAAIVSTAIIAPQLRFSGELHHTWTGDGTPDAAEVGADLRWFWSPLAALHVRNVLSIPWGGVPQEGLELTMDVSL